MDIEGGRVVVDVPEMVIQPSPFNQPNIWAAYLLAVATWIGALYSVTHPSHLGAWLDERVRVALYVWIVVVPLAIASGLISRWTDGIYLTTSHIGHTSLIGAQGEHCRSALARIMLFSERRHRGIYTWGGVLRPVIAFESCEGGELFRVYTRQWSVPDLQRLALACGVPIEGSWEDIRDP